MTNLNVDSKLVEDFTSEEKNYLAYWLSSLETYNPNKVKSLCLLAGTSEIVANEIVGEIVIHVDDSTKMSEIRPLIFALLQKYDPDAAKRFKASDLYVRTSNQNFERFNKGKIVSSLIRETGLTEELSDEIADEVENFIRTLRLDFLSSPVVREIVTFKLLERRLEVPRRMYTRLGTPIYDVEQMINRGVSTDIKRENANLQHTPETINWIISGEALEQYAMLKLVPPHIANSHLSGDYHIHILSNIATRPNCIQHYPTLFFKYGLKIDGTGQHTSVAKPAGHLAVAIQHCAKILLAGQTQMAGGQSIDNFNVWLAPFIRGLSDKEIRQAAQEFIYELNQCFDYSNPLILAKNNGREICKIGEFVESKLYGKEKAVLDEEIFTYTIDQNLNLKKTRIIAVAKRKKKDNENVIEIKTRHGRSVKVTENHPLFVFKDGLTVIPAKEINKGDIVVTFKRISPKNDLLKINLIESLVENQEVEIYSKIFVTGFKKLTDDIARHTKISFAYLARSINVAEDDFWRWRETKRDSAPVKVVYDLIKKYPSLINYDFLKVKYAAGSSVSLPAILNLDSDFIRFLGYYVSEGHAVKDGNTIKISSSDEDIVKDLKDLSKKYKIKICKVSNDDYNFNSKILHTLVTKIFKCGSHADKKRVPNFVFDSEYAMVEFLKAYMSGDGGFWKDWAGCVTTSEMLIHDLLFLYLNLGIVPSIKKRGKGVYKQQFILGIFGKDNLEKFSRIGFTAKRKQERLEKYLNGSGTNPTRTRDIIPLSHNAVNYIKEKKIFEYYNRDKLTNYNFENLMATGYKTELCLLNESVFWDVISEVSISQDYSESVYDLETEDHSFLAGFGFGFLAHNSYVARGGQVVFSNVDFELMIPGYLKDVPAIGPKGKVVGTYGDYEGEARKFLREYVRLKIEGDAMGKQHMWPNDVFKVRPEILKGSEYEEELALIHEYIAKFGTPYIANLIPEWQTENANYMGCRTRLDSNFAGPWGTIRTGNDLYITLNLPRIAYQSRGNDDKFFELMDERLKKMADMLVLKHSISDNILNNQNLLPFLGQKFDGEQYYQLENTTKTFGYAGLTEAAKFHTGFHLHEDAGGQNFGYSVVKYIRDYANEMTKSSGLRFSVIASPAETCAARLSKLDIAKFGSKNVVISGNDKAPYYTNSHMVKMDADVPLSQKVAIEQAYHPLTNGGHIFHIWLGEQSPSADALLDLTKKMCLKTDIGFFAYTKDFTVCNSCANFSYGLKNLCPKCQSQNVTGYSRITGYYQAVHNFNTSKKQELKDRFRYTAPGI
ncbi:MAG: anaerobic ribonucleoside-triphosphate reductase [archaeon]